MTLASKITLVRVAFIPLFMVFMYQSGGAPTVAGNLYYCQYYGFCGWTDRTSV